MVGGMHAMWVHAADLPPVERHALDGIGRDIEHFRGCGIPRVTAAPPISISARDDSIHHASATVARDSARAELALLALSRAEPWRMAGCSSGAGSHPDLGAERLCALPACGQPRVSNPPVRRPAPNTARLFLFRTEEQAQIPASEFQSEQWNSRGS